MKHFLKNRLNLLAFILLVGSPLLPLTAYGGDVLAYCMGYHHGFKEPWPAIQTALYISFFVIFFATLIFLLVRLVLADKKIDKVQQQ